MSIKIPFLKNKHKTLQEESNEIRQANKTPKHIAIIMDGNGRWAKKRGLPRIAGHKEGMNVVQRIVRAASQVHHIEILTLYAFSTENWKRPRPEVDYLLRLPKTFLHVYLPELIENNIRIDTIGNFNSLPKHTKEAVLYAKEKTENNTGMLLNFALNYGGRNEIVEAMREMMKDVQLGKLSTDHITEEQFNNYLYTNGLCDPDLLIRTSGEKRLSNFLLWQSAYSEFWFTDVLWPDFTEELLDQAICDYQARIRRYGGV